MGYLSLYREFRPRTFSEVVGQKHITDTLINQIKTARVGHAYLFTGSRGVGKTTCARIFAKAINCIDSKDGSPCYACEVCEKLDNASNLDITEIDAASNNGVDDARELRERVKYPPVHGKFKVFIIDEVHMLTGSAFNALLKTLEEPPPHVVFILATTEAYKLPATILSRVMRFDFRLLPVQEIEEIIAAVYKKTGKAFEVEAVRYIAALGEGSVRDALSIADRCLSVSEGTLKYADVLELLGAAGQTEIKSLTANLAEGRIGSSLESLDKLIKSGKSVGMIAKDLLAYVRDLLVAKAAPNIIEMPKSEKDALVGAAGAYSVELLASLIQIFSAVETELRYSVSTRTVIETACIRACKLALHDLSALEERIQRLEKHGVSAVGNVSSNIGNSSISSPSISSPNTGSQNIGNSGISNPNDSNINNPNTNTNSNTNSNTNTNTNTNTNSNTGNSNIGNSNTNNSKADNSNTGNPDIVNSNPDTNSLSGNNTANNNDIFNIDNNESRQTAKAAAETQNNITLPSARSLWGRIITQLRTNSPQSVYAIASEIGDIKLEGTTLKIICGRDNYLAVSSDVTTIEFKKAAAALGYECINFEATLVDAQADMDNEIKRIKNLIGNVPFKVNE